MEGRIDPCNNLNHYVLNLRFQMVTKQKNTNTH